MGTFVLGILVGWLAEWLFFNFWIKGRSTGEFADCTALKNEVRRKNTEISALKSELETAKKPLSDTSKEKVQDTKETKITGSNKTKKASTTVVKSSAVNKSTTKKTAIKKATASKNSKPKKQSPAKKSATQKAKATKKVVTTKNAKKSKTGDDLTKLSGIGPSMASTMNELGIDTYKKLANMDDDILRDMLEASGARLNNNKEAMDSWNEQAALADKGDMEGLKKLQDSLKK